MTVGRGEFFAVHARAWSQVCELGLNPAVAYLVLARGTLADQRTTSWSVAAIERYTSISRSRAEAALLSLISAKLVVKLRGGNKPRYRLLPTVLTSKITSTDWIWLPNALISGVRSELPPVERVRQLQDVRALRFFVELYAAHDLIGDGGIHWRFIRQNFSRRSLGQVGRFVLWHFVETDREFSPNGPFKPLTVGRNDRERKENVAAAWRYLVFLERSGLIECVPHLIESSGPDAEIIHPCPSATGRSEEQALGAAARDAALALGPEEAFLARRMEDAADGSIVPVPDELPEVQMVGIYRLRYRPRTAATAAWSAKQRDWEQMVEDYRKLADEAINDDVRTYPTSLQNQRLSRRNQQSSKCIKLSQGD